MAKSDVEKANPEEEAELLEEFEELEDVEELEAESEAPLEALLEAGFHEEIDLEELEELEEVEELSEATAAEESPSSGPHRPSESEIASMASEIEFTPSPEEEAGSSEEEHMSGLEIVSPFATMLSNLDDGAIPPASKEAGNGNHDEDEEDEPEEDAPQKAKLPAFKTSKLEILDGNYRMSLVYRPFTVEETASPQDLESSSSGPVIKARNGVNYIDPGLLNEEPEELDKDFQDLVNSVLRK
jgi:hypothetical protein